VTGWKHFFNKTFSQFNIHQFSRQWVFGSFFCSFCQFSSYLTISLSVFTLLGITMERYKGIMTPLAPRNSHMTLLKSLAIIWAASSFISLPPAIFSRHVQIQTE
jgi:hypothetical protein